MCPPVGRSIPVSKLSTVDFPLPDGPLMAKRLCAGTVKVRSSTMHFFSMRVSITRERCSTRISGCGDGVCDSFTSPSVNNFDIGFSPNAELFFITHCVLCKQAVLPLRWEPYCPQV